MHVGRTVLPESATRIIMSSRGSGIKTHLSLVSIVEVKRHKLLPRWQKEAQQQRNADKGGTD